MTRQAPVRSADWQDMQCEATFADVLEQTLAAFEPDTIVLNPAVVSLPLSRPRDRPQFRQAPPDPFLFGPRYDRIQWAPTRGTPVRAAVPPPVSSTVSSTVRSTLGSTIVLPVADVVASPAVTGADGPAPVSVDQPFVDTLKGAAASAAKARVTEAPAAQAPVAARSVPATVRIVVVQPQRRLTFVQQCSLDAFIRSGVMMQADFSASDLRSAFRTLARRYHPDRHPLANHTEKASLSRQFTALKTNHQILLAVLEPTHH